MYKITKILIKIEDALKKLELINPNKGRTAKFSFYYIRPWIFKRNIVKSLLNRSKKKRIDKKKHNIKNNSLNF